MILIPTLLALLAPTPVEGPAIARHPDYDAVLVCDEPDYNVGTKWIDEVGDAIEHYFPIRNEGTAEAWVRVFYSFAGAQSPCIFPIASGETVYIRLELNSKKLIGRFEKSISVTLIGRPSNARPGSCRNAFGEPFRMSGPSRLQDERRPHDWCIEYALPQ